MLDIDNPAVQEACFHFLRLATVAGARAEREELVRDILLAAAEHLARPEPRRGDGPPARCDQPGQDQPPA